jgi:drug/metabolite transporter (DMT)-like permease
MADDGEGTRAYLAIAIAMVSVSFASILIKWSTSPPFVIAAYRLGLTCLVLLPAMFWTKGFSDIRSMGRKEAGLVLLSGLALTFHFGLWIVSLTLTLVSTSVILVTSHPMFVVAIQHFLLKERVRSAAAMGIVIAFAGVTVIALSDYKAGSESLLGDFLAFLGGICAGIYFLCGRVVRQNVSVIPYSFSVYGLASLLLLVSALVAGDRILVTNDRELTLFLLMALVPTILGHTLFNYALKKVRAHVISTSVLGEPVGASILAYLLLPDQVPSVWIIVGGALVVFGLYIVLRRGYPEADEDLAEPTL